MERLVAWIRDHPQFAAVAFGGAIVILVLGVLSTMMHRSGASLRPILWFAGFFAIVAGPQVVVHLLDGWMALKSTPAAVPAASPTSPRGGLEPVDWQQVFGPQADPDLITDAKLGLGAILGDAREAKIAFSVDGSSALAATFPSADAAAAALNRYGTFFAFAQAAGSDTSGWTARRHGGQGEWVHVVAAGPDLYAWTAANREDVIAHRVRTLGPFDEHSMAAAAPALNPGSRLASGRLAARPGFIVGILSLNLLAACFWFFKGSAWAARVDAATSDRHAAVDTLRQALMSLRADEPLEVRSRPDGAVEVEWRYADARWVDFTRVHRLKRVHRLVLAFDEPHRTVRVREYWSALDASAGVSGLRFEWKQQTGIQFFALEHTRVVGAQLDAQGRPTGELSKAYTFDLQRLKRPLVDTVTGAGWKWQPVTWDAPAAFRWLTE